MSIVCRVAVRFGYSPSSNLTARDLLQNKTPRKGEFCFAKRRTVEAVRTWIVSNNSYYVPLIGSKNEIL